MTADRPQNENPDRSANQPDELLDSNANLPVKHSDALTPNANQADTLSYLNLKEMARNLGVSYDRLCGFAAEKDLRTLVGAVAIKGVKGVRYTEESQQLFAYLLAEQDAGRVNPKTAPAYLAATRQSEMINPPNANRPDNQNMSREEFIECLAIALQRHAQKTLPLAPPDDTLLTSTQAAGLLACSPDKVSRYVKGIEGRRGVWRKSDVLKWIAEQKQR